MPKSLSQKLSDALPFAVPFTGVCFRNVSQRFANQRSVLSATGSRIAGGRFNFIGVFAVLYLSCDVHTCLEETTKSLSLDNFDVAMSLPRTIIGIEVTLSRVLDLCVRDTRRRVGISLADLLRTDWEQTQSVFKCEAITQELGRFARAASFEALLVPSAIRRGRNLDIFPNRLLPSSSLALGNQDRLPMV